DETKERTLKLANNIKLNELARLNKAFRPLTLSDTSNVYYLNDNNDYLAVFNFGDKMQTFDIDPAKINVRKKGTLLNLNTNKRSAYQKIIKVDLKPYDSAIFKVN
ncbi:MAG: hypothetical protein IKX97_06220, partial [Erysipelotrichaceae bacterium]|nr:hypothetical protein [Erysipelotrichaceae bacterium]